MAQKFYGKHPASTPLKALFLTAYLAAAAPITYSPVVRWDQAVKPADWSVLGNDQYGDCVVAAGLHLRQAWAANAGSNFTPTTDQALAEYRSLTGYDPATGANDNGVDENAFCQSWQAAGLVGEQCAGSALINYSNLDLLKFSIEVFGGVLVGTQVTQQCEQQTDAGQPWQDGWWFSPVLGLHGIPLLGYDQDYFYANSWGQIVRIAPQWVLRRFDEAHVIVDKSFIASTGKTPGNLNLEQLLADQAWAAAA
jgi:hypothetical protein